jgi:erythritol kinase
VHLLAKPVADVHLNREGTGYVIALPIPDTVTQVQTNMGATINIDWLLEMAAYLMAEAGKPATHTELVARIDRWFFESQPGSVVYHPYISEAGERGPFVNAQARAGFSGLSVRHGFPDLVRAVVEGLALATRDCYAAMGEMPDELRVTGGAVRSSALRRSLTASLKAPIRLSRREETGAAGAAMMAAVAIGAYRTMDDCIADWVTPLLGEAEEPVSEEAARFDLLFSAYADIRKAMPTAWEALARAAAAASAK